MPAIELRHITHAYDTTPVLQDFSLQVEGGRLTCLLGGSGCGKTTLLRIIAGLETPVSGEVLIDGKEMTRNGRILVPPHRRSVGFIFQDLALWPHFTVYKNIAFGLKEKKETNIKEKVEEILNFFGLEDHAGKYPHELSGGQKQLVAIARSLVLRPRILLMDEPLANLDVKLKRKILDHIRNLKEQFDLTLLYVTHDHREAFSIADVVTVLNDGDIEETGTVEQIKNSKNEFVRYFLEY
jgi:ABC-type Fe3+/spermidine/putrescine transport system ATPase subunit